MRCCICSINLYVAKTWTVRKIDKSFLESFKMCMEKDGQDKVNRSYENKCYTESKKKVTSYIQRKEGRLCWKHLA
jgi:hypothetical protein